MDGTAVQWHDLNAGMHYLMGPDGVPHKAPLFEGDAGFAHALHDGEVVVTEVPNLLLSLRPEAKSAGGRAATKAKAKAKATPKAAAQPTGPGKKRKAKKPSPAQDEDAGAKAPEDDGEGLKFGIMYYKAHNLIGVRQKFGEKRQVFAFGGKRCGKDQTALVAIGQEVVAKLEAGELAVDSACEWAKERAMA